MHSESARSSWRHLIILTLGLGLLGAADSEALLKAGKQAQEQGRYTEAITLYTQGLASDAGNTRLLRMRAEAFQYIGNLTRAEADLNKGLGLAPDNPALLEGMGWLKLFQQDYKASEGWLRKSLAQQEPDDQFWTRLNLAHALLLQRREPEAIAQYCQLAQTPDGPAMGQAMRHDFARLRQIGIGHPLFDTLALKFTPTCGLGLVLPAECKAK